MVIRDYSGEVIAAKAVFFGSGTSLFAELQALYVGMCECLRLGLTKVLIESDSKLVVDMLTSKSTWPWQHYSILRQLSLFLTNGEFLLHHIFREANAVADGLSKLASSSREDFLFTSVSLPHLLKGLVALDKVSYPYIRL